MLILDVGFSAFSATYSAADVFYVNQNPITNNQRELIDDAVLAAINAI